MKETYLDKQHSEFDDEIDLKKIFYVLLEGRKIIFSLTGFITCIAVIYSLLLPNIYESKALLVPVDITNGISRALGGYSSLAGLAGISLPSGVEDGNSAKAIKKITSLSFFKENILANIYLPNLMAVKSWNYETNTIVYNKKIYDINTAEWVRNYSYPQKQIPTYQESYEVFIEDHLSLIEDKKSGFITLTIKHQSPYIAKQWAELIVKEVDNFYRVKDKLESEKAVNYLNKQISLTSLSEIKKVLAELLQEETKKLTLIEANQAYVFDYIDPPAVMEEKAKPSRVMICIVGIFLGGILGVLLVLIRHYFLVNNTQ